MEITHPTLQSAARITRAQLRTLSRRLPGARRRWVARVDRIFGNPATIASRERAIVEIVHQVESALPSPPPVWSWPVEGVVRSGFGLRFGRMHYGIDIASPEGTSVLAAGPGTVRLVTTLPDYGVTTVISHGGRLTTLYAHQRDVAVAVGQDIDRGQVIGSVGTTGRVTGPHLHFEIRQAGTPQDPSLFLPTCAQDG